MEGEEACGVGWVTRPGSLSGGDGGVGAIRTEGLCESPSVFPSFPERPGLAQETGGQGSLPRPISGMGSAQSAGPPWARNEGFCSRTQPLPPDSRLRQLASHQPCCSQCPHTILFPQHHLG